MCRTIWIKACRDALANRARAALVVLALAVGVFGVGSIAGAALILQRELARSIAAVNPAQLLFDTTPLDQQRSKHSPQFPGWRLWRRARSLH